MTFFLEFEINLTNLCLHFAGEKDMSVEPKQEASQSNLDQLDQLADSMADGVEGGLHFLRSVEVGRAKVIFILGVMVYLLLSFIHYGKIANIMALESQKQQLAVHFEKPLRPTPPLPPLQYQANWYKEGSKSSEFVSHQKKYEINFQEYTKKLETYKEDTLKKWKVKHKEWEHKKNQLITQKLPFIQMKIQTQKAYLHAWSYTYHCLRYVAILLMAFGCMIMIFHGNPYEKAVSLFILGYILVGMLKIQDAVVIGSNLAIG